MSMRARISIITVLTSLVLASVLLTPAVEAKTTDEKSLAKSSCKPLIGINLDRVDGDPTEYSIQYNYVEAIRKAGGLPILIPPVPSSEMSRILDKLDGVLMIGGSDYPPTMYGEKQEPSVVLMADERSDFDIRLAKATIARKDLPFLGICAGAQAMNIATGGSLVQDIPSIKKNSTEKVEHASPDGWQKGFNMHEVSFKKNTRLSKIYNGKSLKVPTSHHQCVKQPGKGLIVSATTVDGVIESIEGNEDRFLVGVQWHPERDFKKNRVLFDEFIKRCRERSAKNDQTAARPDDARESKSN